MTKPLELAKSKEIISLLKRIEEGATSDGTSLTEVLRLCMRLGKQLENAELTDWARKEASGYTDAEDLPDYRKLPTESRGDFYGPFGSGIKNAHIPNSAIEKEHQEVLCNVFMFEPVAELEALAINKTGKANVLQLPWSGNLIAYYQQKELYSNGMTLATAWRLMTKQKLTGVLETIRTRVLDFVLKIEEELGIESTTLEDEIGIVEPKPQDIKQIFNTAIYGGNVAQGDSGDTSQQTINIDTGDLTSLLNYLQSLGMKKSLLDELETAINNDQKEVKKPGPAVSQWITKATKIGLKGGLSVASNIAGSMIATAILKFYGMH